MIYEQLKVEEIAEQKKERRRKAIIIALLMGIVGIIVATVSFVVRARAGRTDMIVPVAIAGFALINLFSAGMARKDRLRLAITMLLTALTLGIMVMITQIEGIGLFVAVTGTALAIGVASQTLHPSDLRSAISLIVVSGIILILTELFWSAERTLVNDSVRIMIVTFGSLILVVVAYSLLRQFNNYPLRTKFILSFLMLTTAPLIILAYQNNIRTRETLTENANEKLQAAATKTADELDTFIGNTLSVIRVEANLLTLTGLEQADLSDALSPEVRSEILTHLHAYQEKDPANIKSYAFIGTNGRNLVDTNEANEGLLENQHEYFQQTLTTDSPYMTPVKFLPGVDEPVIHFAAVVRGDRGQPLGVLRARYRAAVLQDMVVESVGLVGGQSFGALFDENLMHLAHGTAPETLYTLIARPEARELGEFRLEDRIPRGPIDEAIIDLPELAANLTNAAEQPFFAATDVATGDKINQVAVVKMRRQPWQIAFFQPQEVFLEPVEAQTQTTILLGLFMAGAVVGLALLASETILGPITHLTETAIRVAGGDPKARADIHTEDEVGILARTFNSMADRLQAMLERSEARVAERTRALEVSSEVSRSLSTILDQDKLVRTVVDQVKSAFHYYHAHIYLLDEKTDILQMVGGTGKAGQTMLDQGHHLKIGQGLVGRAAAKNTVVLVPDVEREDEWLPNPLLPDTKAEIAVPITLGDKLLGVLDVQHNETDSLTEQDAELLRSVANQVAIGLQNARLYETTRQRVRQQELLNQIGQKIQNTTNITTAMQVAIRELGQAVGASKTKVVLKTSTNHQDEETSS